MCEKRTTSITRRENKNNKSKRNENADVIGKYW